MRIAIFTDTYHPEINGVTNTLDCLAGYLYAHGEDYLVFSPDYAETASPREEHALRFRGLIPHVNPSSRLAFPHYQTVLDALEAFHPDVVHITTELGIGFCGLRAARELGLPVVMSYHTNFDQYLSCYDFGQLKKLYWKYMTWFHSFAAVNLCPSEDTRRALALRGVQNLDIWSRGVDLARFSPKHASNAVREKLGGGDRMLFLYAGRISREKGLDTLAKSIRILHEWYGDQVGFVFAGDGPYLRELSDFQLPNTVLAGFQDKESLARIYASCDAFVFPSATETFGNVVLEAMASGLPVICVGAGGVTDFTAHLDNAYVCHPKHVMGLTYGMSALVSSPALREKLRQGGLATARARSWESVFARLMEQYQLACAKQGVAAGRYTDKKLLA